MPSADGSPVRVDSVRVGKVITSGTFSLDGGTWNVDNNVWLIGDDRQVLVVDAAHAAAPIVDAVGGRRVVANVLTHAHDDHISAAGQLRDAVHAPVWLHPNDRMLWDAVYPSASGVASPDHDLADGAEFTIAGVSLRVLHTPGHTPGSCCLWSPELGAVFSGDTLFAGGPGATGRSYSSFEQIIGSIRTRLLTLPEQTVVHTGHGDDTTIGAEAPHLDEWVARGH